MIDSDGYFSLPDFSGLRVRCSTTYDEPGNVMV